MSSTKRLRSHRLMSREQATANKRLRQASRRLVAEALERRMLLTTITALEPLAESHDAPVSTNVTATFDQDINPGTVSPLSFAVHGSQSGRLLGAAATISTTGPTVTLDPTSDFFPGEVVRVTATSAIRSTGGDALTKSVWNFRTGPALGSGSFVDSGQTDLGSTYKNRLGDLDGDGDLDAYVLDGTGASRIMMNDGTGVFTTSQSLGNFNSYDARLGDLDGDGDLDAFVISEIYTSNRVVLNDGTGQFSVGQLLGDHASLSVDLGDLDGDGDLDAYVGTRETNRVLLNNGSGIFTDTNQNVGRDPSRKVKIGDVDQDGDLDLLSGNPDNPDKIWLNNGSATFTDSGQMLGAYASRAVDFGDVDGDGDMDLVMAHRDVGNQVLLNEGGVFTDSGQRLGDHDTWGLALGDVDADGDLDIMSGNEGEGDRVWLNDGAGVFSDSGQMMGSATTRAIEFGDLDLDGDLDAFIGNLNGSRIWLNENLTPSVALSVDNETIAESGEVATFTATLSAAATQSVTIDLELTGTADAADYTASATQIVIAVGDTSGSITVTAVDDTLDEPDETVIVDIVSATGASESGVQQQTTTITDNDEPPVPDVTLTLDNENIPEAAGVATFTISLSEVTSLPVTVDVGITGTASSADFVASGTQVVIAPGATTRSITVTAVQDEESEQDETVIVDITAVSGGAESGVQQQTTTIVDDDLPPSFSVTALEATDSGFRAEFSAPLDGSALNLFDTLNAGLGPADVVVAGASSGEVAGSLIVDATAAIFVKSGGPLAADTYTVTLRSGVDGFKDTDARLLDGDADGTGGDDYVGSFTVSEAPDGARTVSIPDFVRGPGQDVNLPADQTTGIPITISDGEDVRAADVRIAYDPARLEITGATAPAGGSVIVNTTTTPGIAILVFFSSTSLPAGSGTFINLQATVPTDDASGQYGEQQLLDVHAVTIGDGNDNEFPVIVDDGLHFSTYFADVSGNGRINASDAAQVARFAALIDGGFASSLTTDPILVGDISGNGRINAADASRVAQFAALIDVPEIPPVPGGIQITGVPTQIPGIVQVSRLAPGNLGILLAAGPQTTPTVGSQVESDHTGFRVERNFYSQAAESAIMSDRAVDLVMAQEAGEIDVEDDLILAVSSL